jgi:predicted secreted protein
MRKKTKGLSIVVVISIAAIVLATSAGVAQASEWQEPHPNASSGAHYEHVGGMVEEGSDVSNASPVRHSKVIYGQNLSAKTIPEQVVLTEEDNGSSVNVYKGQELIIELESNPSTGYRWEIREIDKSIFRLSGIEFGKPETDLLGAPQKQVFRFEVIAKGETIIRLVYWRPWEKIPIYPYSVNVKSELTTVSIQPPEKTKDGSMTPVKRFASVELTKEGPKTYFGPNAKIRPSTGIEKQLQNVKSWTTVMTEDFEWDFPGTKWNLLGNPTWDETNYRAYSGSQSGYCADGGSSRVDPPGPYPNNMHAEMIYGPFDLSDAKDAKLFFNHWSEIEGSYDRLFVGASVNNHVFYGEAYSGDWKDHCGGWCPGYFDLTDVYVLGNLCGYKNVWIAFVFSSDDSITYEGTYLDDIILSKDTWVPPALPTSFDWRAMGGVTPIKDQGACGSCWAFGTVCPLEANIKIKDGVTVDLSEQFLVSCNVEPSMWGCDGGWWAHDYHWNKVAPGNSEAGAVLESEFPYQASDVPCCGSCPYSHPYKLSSWSCLGKTGTPPDCCTGSILPINEIKEAIMTYGPISAGVCIGPDFQDYTGGIFETDQYCWGGINHAVCLVGWDDTQGNNGVWILRNSWREGWGENGYMRIGYGIASVGQCANYIIYAPPHFEYSGPTWLHGELCDSSYPLTGDWDDDSRTDVAAYYPGDGNWEVALSTGSNFVYTGPTWLHGELYESSYPYRSSYPLAGDWNGDGRTDILVYYPDDGNWEVALSTGSNFVYSGNWLGGQLYRSSYPLAGDWNGDGRTDLLVYYPGDGNWEVALSTGSNFVYSGNWLGGQLYDSSYPLAGDWNDDDRTDILAYYPDGGNWEVALSTSG